MAQEKKERIFISYKRVDKERVFAIKDGIEQATGEKCWIDLDGIESDAQFVAKIMTAIDQCDVFLFMRSNAHNKIVDLKRDWTYREVNYALKKEKSIVFINLDNSQSPDWVSFMFPHQQEIDATDPDKLARLNKDLCEWLGIGPTLEPDPAELEKAKRDALPEGEFQVGDLMYKASEKGCSVTVIGLADKEAREIEIPAQIQYGKYTFTVDTIGTGAFYRCTKLASITISNSVTSIGESAFARCSRMTSVTIPNSVTSIGEYAFCRCTKLASITIPNSVTSIGEMAFAWCSGLTSVTIPNSMTSIGNEFSHCHGLTDIIIPNSVTSISEFAFCYCHGLVSVTIPNSVTKIGHAAFMECSGLTSITLPINVISIEEHTFAHCIGLSSITIPNSVTSIGDWAFQNCKALSTITIPNSVTSIGEGAFSWCSALKSIKIPKGLTNIGVDAFPRHTKVIHF